ncbi:MAG: translesion error-prone DNA polymerase V autoproteolytic subunit [Bacteroidales bacterium]|nr:translesion error-prone DNA polymerase V autoproteolytic subunit [Bacteroidales bacterium]MDD4292793.1 translesion error-prone DNA polymerase V autoproteolytic subunit [Bacteroidales bacterium]MDD4492137.1 translesion error-prone DNA polymerase V autoproteolytic subunit [Bacteroidales bacterium]
MKNKNIEILKPDSVESLNIKFSDTPVNAGFPSPAENHMESTMDLNRALVKNPSSTFYARVKGESMINDGVDDGDILVIDRSVEPYENCLAVCFLDGEFTLKRVRLEGEDLLLVPANEKFKPIRVKKDNDFYVWGIVRYLIKRV